MAATELHRLLIDTVSQEQNAVLQFDPERQVLRSWLWYAFYCGGGPVTNYQQAEGRLRRLGNTGEFTQASHLLCIPGAMLLLSRTHE